jgi:hypothetical protein
MCPSVRIQDTIDAEIVNEPRSAANAAVPAGFAGSLAEDWFIGKLGRNNACMRILALSREVETGKQLLYRVAASPFCPRGLTRCQEPFVIRGRPYNERQNNGS